MPNTRRVFVLLGVVLVGVIVIAARFRADSAGNADFERSDPERAEVVASTFDLATPHANVRVQRDPIEPSTVEESVADDAVPSDLVEILGEVARAERARNARRFERLVDDALSPRHGLAAVLSLLERRGFDEEAEPFAGALTVVASAATRERVLGENGDLARILARSPLLLENARARLAPLLADLEVDGRLVLHAQWWPTLLELQRAHPDLAEDLGPLFENLHRDAEGLRGLSNVLQQAATLVEFPRVVAAAIHGLTMLDPALGASVAHELRGRSDLDVELQHELARLSASLLSPSEAVDALATQPRSIAMQAMLLLGERPEASEALRRKYDDLALSADTERDRMNVIAGMRHEESRFLLGIARTDTSVRVREQAVLMLTSSRSLDTEAVRAIHDLRHAGSDSIGARSYTSALANVVVHSSGTAREEALELLRALVNDATVSESDRSRATELLERHTPAPEEHVDAPPDVSDAIQAGK